MFAKPTCTHCDTPLQAHTRFCDRCGAPVVQEEFRDIPVPPGMVAYQDVWRGFRLALPESWRVTAGDGVRAWSALGDTLEMRLLDPALGLDAAGHASLFFDGFATTVQPIQSSGGEAAFTYENEAGRGCLRVRASSNGGVLLSMFVPHRSQLDPAQLLDMVAPTLASLQAIPREAWVDPAEGAMRLMLPRGWQARCQVNNDPMRGTRQPCLDIWADRAGQIRIQVAPIFKAFQVEQPAAPAEQGLLGTLWGWAKKVDQMAYAAMGTPALPFGDLERAFDQYFWPEWQRAEPGLRMLDRFVLGPMVYEVRLGLANGHQRRVRLQAHELPRMELAPPQWAASVAYSYQAPTPVMEQFEPLLTGVATTIEVSPQWMQREQARMQQMAGAMMMSQRNHNQFVANEMAKRTAIISEAGAAISDMQMAGWQNYSQSTDYTAHNFSNYVRDTGDYFDPAAGAVYNLPSGHDRVWSDGAGTLYGSDWSFEPLAGWNELTPL
ncbi:MAG: hypothetical protein AB7S38_21820 [Vulcanimicrobiota bacterium]